MSKLHNSRKVSFIFISALISFVFTLSISAQQELPKNFRYESFSLQEDSPMEIFGCQTSKHYDNISYFWSIPNDFTTFTIFAQKFTQNPNKKIKTINLFVYDGFDDFSDSSGQGIELIFYTGNSEPQTEYLRIQIPSVNIAYYPDTTIIDVSSYNFRPLGLEFLIGFTVVNQSIDKMAFFSDDNNVMGSIAYGYGDKDRDGVFTWYNFEDYYSGYYDFAVEAVYCYDPVTIRVPEDYSTIQQAVDSAYDFDTILVNDGTYSFVGTDNIDILYKQLVIKSVNGPEFTIIEGDGDLPVIAFNFTTLPNYTNRLNEVIDGFTFKNFHGGVIKGEFNHSFTIKNCVFYHNAVHYGVISCGGVDLVIENCTIAGNLSLGNGLLEIMGGNPTISNTIINHNGIGEAIYSLPAATAYPYYDIQNTNIYAYNDSDWTEHLISQAFINGNISEDPLFCDAINGDLHINEYSFCNPNHPLNINNTLMGFYGVNCSGCDDIDSDGICDVNDNCVDIYNPEQTDTDLDGLADSCDPCINDPDNDSDADGFCADTDNCPNIYNPTQLDTDSDSLGDSCDNCVAVYNPAQTDIDQDGIGDSCDTCTDSDNDGFGNPGFSTNTCPVDNCPTIYNPDQIDLDGDGIGDDCDGCFDTDYDGFGNPGYSNIFCEIDNCPDIYNPSQSDANFDGVGDSCCCVGIRGNTDGDPDEIIDISDLVEMVDHMFGESVASCKIEYDVDADGLFDISDLVYFVTFMFQNGTDPHNCP